MSNKFLRPLLILFVTLLALQFFMGKKENPNAGDDITLSLLSKPLVGKEVQVRVQNHSANAITLPDHCPKNPLTVEEYLNGEWILKEAEVPTEKCAGQKDIALPAGESHLVKYDGWSWELFKEAGRYRISISTILDGKEKIYFTELNLEEPSFLRMVGREAFYKPILNTLVFLISVAPGFSLGWAVILLTLLIKIILLIPNQKALKAQKKMQKVQPELEALKRKYKDSPQKLAEETMLIWKKYKVNPMQSCLPMLIQFPILIALFYVVKDGLTSIHPGMLYDGLTAFDLSKVQTVFLGVMNLTEANKIILPVLVGGLQFLQMKMTLGKSQALTTTEEGGAPNPMVMMNKSMLYFMPVIIAVFTAGMPAAVGFYWGTSTLFGIGQQLVVNRSKD